MKRPSFQFYPADWLNHEELNMCSWDAQGLWIHLVCRMYRTEKIGFLFMNGKKMTPDEIQKLSKMSPKKFQKCWSELTTFGVVLYDENYGFYCKRIREDEEMRQIRANCGKRGGNPNLVNQNSTTQVKLDPTPSSSSSSSSSSSGDQINNLNNTHTGERACVREKKSEKFAQESLAFRQIVERRGHTLGNLEWLDAWVSDVLETNKLHWQEVQQAWKDTCDLAIEKKAGSQKWYRTTFMKKLKEMEVQEMAQQTAKTTGLERLQAMCEKAGTDTVRNQEDGQLYSLKDLTCAADGDVALPGGGVVPVGWLKPFKSAICGAVS